MDYKQKYIASLKIINSHKIFVIFLGIIEATFCLRYMNLLIGYFSTIFLFYLLIKDSIKSYQRNKEEINIIRRFLWKNIFYSSFPYFLLV